MKKCFGMGTGNGDAPVKPNILRGENMSNMINGSISDNALSDAISTAITCLPSAKEYREIANAMAAQYTAQWSAPKYQCPKCGGGMRKNQMIVLTTYPEQYEYQCDKCGYIEYQYM